MADNLKIINMNDVEVEEINWLWYPYLPFGKISIIQGDPGTGKTTMILAIAAAMTRGVPLPQHKGFEPINVVYQTAEDGLGDTVKPRLLQVGADCNRVSVIDESEQNLTLSDTRIERTIGLTNAKLFILDPLQAYLGADVDMHRANEVRPVFKRLSVIAEKTGCAMVIVGHINKGGSKSQYRGLGSIDIQAAARSVLTVGRVEAKPNLRAFAHGKSNLAPEGVSIAFELNPKTGFQWVGEYSVTIDELLSGSSSSESVSDLAVHLLKKELAEKPLPANVIIGLAEDKGISKRTLSRVKSELGIKSFKRQNEWYWSLNKKEELQECQDSQVCQERQVCQQDQECQNTHI